MTKLPKECEASHVRMQTACKTGHSLGSHAYVWTGCEAIYTYADLCEIGHMIGLGMRLVMYAD